MARNDSSMARRSLQGRHDEKAIELAISLIDVLVPCQQLYREAFLLARSVRQPAYDMFYLALARREDAEFLTTDRALRKEAERQGLRVL